MDNMNSKLPGTMNIDFTAATERAMRVRRLYHKLEEQNHNTVWTPEEDMLAFVSDVGLLARLVMASEGRWVHGGNLHVDLRSKMAECLWWLLVLSDRLGIDITEEFTSFMGKLDTKLDV
jgi:NTP pyrophosphatase (non-canonical NTP hydrolase)